MGSYWCQGTDASCQLQVTSGCDNSNNCSSCAGQDKVSSAQAICSNDPCCVAFHTHPSWCGGSVQYSARGCAWSYKGDWNGWRKDGNNGWSASPTSSPSSSPSVSPT